MLAFSAQRRLLQPGLAGGVLVVLLWGWRLGAWLARDAFAEALPGSSATYGGVALGLGGDLLLGLGAVLIARGVAATTSVWRARPAAMARRSAVGVVGLTIVAATFARAIDLTYCYLGQCHFTAEGFLYLNAGSQDLFFTPRGLLLIAATSLAAGLPIWALSRDAKRSAQGINRTLPTTWVVALGMTTLTVGAGMIALITWHASHRPLDVHDLALLPEVNLARQYQAFTSGSVCAGGDTYCVTTDAGVQVNIPPKTWARWQQLGLVPATAKADAPFPLLRFGDGESPLPYPKKAGAITHPNVVLTLMESLSGHFIHALSGVYAGLTPGLNRMAQRMTNVRGFYNTASPTVNAMAAILCSVHPSRHPGDLGVGEQTDGQAPMTCLADILRDRGYRTVFVEPVTKTVTGIEYFMRTHGFEEVHGRADIQRALPGQRQGPWGPHDDTLRRYIQQQITRLEALRAKDGRPFLLVYITIDSHEPGMHDAEVCQLPKVVTATGKAIADVPPDSASIRQLTSVYCADKEMGKMADFILDQPRRDQTLWAVTSDHALIRTPSARKALFKSGWYGGFAPLPFLIHDPLHTLPTEVNTLSGSTDIVPTLVHLLGGMNGPNSLTGYSVFGRRKTLPFIVGRMGSRLVMMAEPGRKQERGLGSTRKRCKDGGKFFTDAADDPLSPCDLLGYFSWQDSLFRARRLLPAAHFRGLTVTDVKGLAKRQDLNRAERKLRSQKLREKPVNPGQKQ